MGHPARIRSVPDCCSFRCVKCRIDFVSIWQNSLQALAPLSTLLAISLLAGGLAVLLLDLGRPDRLIIAMTYYNFKSIFAWNIILYTGFMVIVATYAWMMLERRMNQYSKIVGLLLLSGASF